MKFSDIVEQATDLLQRTGRVSYRVLKREFDLDDEGLEDLKESLTFSHPQARDEGGRGLVWTEDATASTSGSSQTQAPTQVSTPSKPITQPQPSEPATPVGERRQLTVMFCDLVGSTAFSEKLDPEELRQMVRAYQDACRQVIERYDGYIAQYLGDGLLIYFGYPGAHEDDGIRSVRTGLEILDSLQQLELAYPLQVRIGIHTGHVLVGEIGNGGRREQLALGDTPNIAARVQGKAEPNTVVISADTYHLVQGYFACRDLGPQDLKGLSAPLTLHQVQGEGEAQNRFDVSVQKGLTPLVGREEESELLLRRWERAKGGERQVVLLSGEAGIGKSRLVQVLRAHIADEPQFGAVFRCSPFYQNSAFYPIIDRLQRFLKLGRTDTPDTKLHKLTRVLALAGMTDQESIALLATLLSIPLPDDYPPLQLSPQKQKEKTLQTLVAWLQHMASQKPVRLEIEDLHWADPSTIELLGLLIDQVPSFRMLVLLTFRPEFTPPWPTRAYMLPIQLSRLPQNQIADMVQQVAGKGLPEEVVQQLIAKSDGVPLYVEEMTKNLIESGLLKETDGRFEVTGPLPQLTIPTTLQDSFASRLDRLAPVRELAQIGAVLGREFSYELIHAVAKLDEATLQEGLRQLGAAEILYQRGVPPQATYSFKHSLLQDVSYESLLKSKRQQLHTQTAQVLEQQFPETTELHPELVAHHYTEATLSEQAIPYWQQAGEKSMQSSAYVEAVHHFTQGVRLLQTLSNAADQAEKELAMHVPLVSAFIALKGYGSPEVEATNARLQTLCTQLGETPQLHFALYGKRVFSLLQAETRSAREMDEQNLQVAESLNDPLRLYLANGMLGESLLYIGELPAARERIERALEFEDQHARIPPGVIWLDTRVINYMYLSVILSFLGYPKQSQKWESEGLDLAESLSQPFTLAFALCLACWSNLVRQEVEICRKRAQAAMALATEQGFPNWLSLSQILYGWTKAEQGEPEEAILMIREGIEGWKATGAKLSEPSYLGNLATAYGRAGRYDEGLELTIKAMANLAKTEQRIHEAELYLTKGYLLLHKSPDDTSEAEVSFQDALTAARHQQAKSLELRAATSLARLWRQQGKTTEAHDLLAPVYNWFTEGFDTPDLKDAKALLDELA